MKRLLYIHLLWLAALTGCDGSSVRETIGLSRKPPDEFRVLARPPLSVPPEFNLRPPAGPGEVAGGAEAPAHKQAESLVLGGGGGGGAIKPGIADTAVLSVSAGELPSSADEQFLKNAGADRASADIRTVLQQEAPVSEPSEKSWLEKLREPSNKDPLVDAAAESERLKANKKTGKSVTEGTTPMVKPKDSGPLGKILGRE